jgi:tetratricopeptide (TPR) repeat protein
MAYTTGKDPKLLSDYYDHIGLLCFQQGFYEEAIINYDLAINNNNTNTSALHNLALLYLTLATNSKKNDENFETNYLNCQNVLHTILEHEPHHPHALHTQASLYELTEDYEQAITHYLQAREYCSIEDLNTLSAITTNLAECYAQSGHGFYQAQDYLTAEAFYKQSLEEDPQHHISKNQLGMCLYKLRDFNGARRHFNALINFPLLDHPSQHDIEQNQEIRADAWINRAATLRKTGAF